MMGDMTAKQALELELLEVRQKLRSCEQFNQVRFAWSIFWAQKATSQTNYARNITDGLGMQHTDAEKEKDAFDTAKRHIRIMEESLDEIHKLRDQEMAIVKELMETYEEISP